MVKGNKTKKKFHAVEAVPKSNRQKCRKKRI